MVEMILPVEFAVAMLMIDDAIPKSEKTAMKISNSRCCLLVFIRIRSNFLSFLKKRSVLALFNNRTISEEKQKHLHSLFRITSHFGIRDID